MIAPHNNLTPIMRSSLISTESTTSATTPSSSSLSSVVTIKNYLRDGIHVMKYGKITNLTYIYCVVCFNIIYIYFIYCVVLSTTMYTVVASIVGDSLNESIIID